MNRVGGWMVVVFTDVFSGGRLRSVNLVWFGEGREEKKRKECNEQTEVNIPDASIDGFVIDMSRDPTLVKSDNLDWKINKLTDAK